MTAQRLTGTREIVTTYADVTYVSNGAPIPPDQPVGDCLPAKPTVFAAWTLALICSVRLAPTKTLYTTVQRIPPGAKARLTTDGAIIEPNFAVEAQRLSQHPSESATSAIRAWVNDLPSDSLLLDDSTLASAAILGAAPTSRPLAADAGGASNGRDCYPTIRTDMAGLPTLPGRLTTSPEADAPSTRTTVVADGLHDILALGREEVADLLNTVPKQSRLGAEVVIQSDRRSGLSRLWKRNDDAAHDHQSAGRETVLLPPWVNGEAQSMIHTAALASNGAWANWFDGADTRCGRVFWSLTDPENDDHLRRPRTTGAIRDPGILAAALLPDPRKRAAVSGGRLFDVTPLRTLAADRRYVVDADARARRIAAGWVQRNRERIPLLLRDGWMDGRGWLDPAGLSDVLSDPFARTELALPIARTVALDAWLSNLDPEAE